MKYIFIRHGKTHFNEIGLKQGWCDSPLTKEGIQQIEKMSQLLKDEKITKAYTSPTLRAKQTAQIILKEHDVLLHEDERLKEVNFGVLEGLPCSFVDTLHLESPSWLDDLEMDYTSYQGENIDDVIIRQQEVLKEIEKISNEEECIVVVGHGCSLYALIKTLLKDEKIAFPGNASAYILCKKLNIPVSNVDFANEVKNYFEGMDSRDTKEELSNIKSIADEVSNRAERGIYRLQQERDSASRGEER